MIDLIFSQDTKPLECWGAPRQIFVAGEIAPENYHDKPLSEWLSPEEIGWLVDNPTLDYCTYRHISYQNTQTFDNSDNLEVEIVKTINDFYSEIHKFYAAADGHRWGCGIWGTYASVSYFN